MKASGNRIVTGRERFHIGMLHGQQLCTDRGVRVMLRWSFLKTARDWCFNDEYVYFTQYSVEYATLQYTVRQLKSTDAVA